MPYSRYLVLVVAGIIVVLSLLTGPAIGLIDIPEDQPFGGPGLGEGSATVDQVTFTDEVSLSRGEFGADQYVLRAGDAEVTATNITGRPFLVYKLDIEELGYTRSSLTTLEPGMEGRLALALSRDTLPAERITRDSYHGQLRVLLRHSGPDRLIATKNVTVRVEG